MTAADRCPDCGAEEWVEDGPFGDVVCGCCGAYADRQDDGPVWTPVVTIETRGRT